MNITNCPAPATRPTPGEAPTARFSGVIQHHPCSVPLCRGSVDAHLHAHTPLCFATVGVSCVHASVFTCVHMCMHLSACCGIGGLTPFALPSHLPGQRANPKLTTCGGCTWEPTPRRSARPVRGEPPTVDPLSVLRQTLSPLCHQVTTG